MIFYVIISSRSRNNFENFVPLVLPIRNSLPRKSVVSLEHIVVGVLCPFVVLSGYYSQIRMYKFRVMVVAESYQVFRIVDLFFVPFQKLIGIVGRNYVVNLKPAVASAFFGNIFVHIDKLALVVVSPQYPPPLFRGFSRVFFSFVSPSPYFLGHYTTSRYLNSI